MEGGLLWETDTELELGRTVDIVDRLQVRGPENQNSISGRAGNVSLHFQYQLWGHLQSQ
jgi:hypothetical protein